MSNRLKQLIFFPGVVSVLVLLSQVCGAATVSELLQEAELLFHNGKTEEARLVHERILMHDTTCLESTFWLGNYYFLKGEEKRTQADLSYNLLPYPSSMQSAYYQEQLKAVCLEYHLKADTLIQRALRMQPNEYLRDIEGQINTFKIKTGLSKPPVVRRSPLLRLFRLKRDSTALP